MVRYQGGPNAGHTVVPHDRTVIMHQLPTGILREGCTAIAGPGMVISPRDLLQEISDLKAAGEYRGNLLISERAHVLLPIHRLQDAWEEDVRGARAAGTTRRGIGPAYMDRVGRFGLRMADLARPGLLREKLDILYTAKKHMEGSLAGLPPKEEMAEQLDVDAEALRPYITATEPLLWKAARDGRNIILEGAQSALLDVDYGTYPFVTSSHPTAAGALVGSGLPPQELDEVMGVAKAYSTRVGSGPFPTELQGAEGDQLREAGGERGSTTGRPRRTGWLDLVLLRYAARLNGLSSLAIVKVDVLGGRERIPVCVGYTSRQGERIEDYPPVLAEDFEKVEPIMQELPGWETFGASLKARIGHEGFRALPYALKAYLAFVSREVGVPITLVSYGPQRRETVEIPAGALSRIRGLEAWRGN